LGFADEQEKEEEANAIGEPRCFRGRCLRPNAIGKLAMIGRFIARQCDKLSARKIWKEAESA